MKFVYFLLKEFVRFFIYIAIFIAILYLYFSQKIYTPNLVFIPKKDKFQELKSQGIPITFLDKVIIKIIGDIKEGWIRVPAKISRFEFIKALYISKREKTRNMVMFAGATIDEFTKKISKQANLNQTKLLNIYYHLSPYKEGGILSLIYKIPYKTKEFPTIFHMVSKSQNIFKTLSLKYKKKYSPKEFEKYLIIASIIQKETHHKEEMPLIAAVIYNRLNRDIPLQIDATLNYGKYSHTPVTPYRIRNDKSKYNTYYHKGLPPKPLCSVSIDALKAALNPPKLGYLYFVRTINGYHRFSISYKDHLANITLYKVEKAKLRKYKSFLKAKKK